MDIRSRIARAAIASLIAREEPDWKEVIRICLEQLPEDAKDADPRLRQLKKGNRTHTNRRSGPRKSWEI